MIALFPLINPITDATECLGGISRHLVHVIHQQMSFDDATSFLLGQIMEDHAEMLTNLPNQRLARPRGKKHDMVVAFPLGRRQTLVGLRPYGFSFDVTHQATYGGVSGRIAQSSSSLPGRARGLPHFNTLFRRTIEVLQQWKS